jgi:hypothetical protein
MVRPKNQGAPRKIVWRMDATAPQGGYRDANAPQREPERPDDIHERGLLASSLELLGGVQVSEAPMDTLPGELIDEFFKR